MNAVHWDSRASDEIGRQSPVDMREFSIGHCRAEVTLRGTTRLTLRFLDSDFSKLKVLDGQRSYPAEYELSQQVRPSLAGLAKFSAKGVHTDHSVESLRWSLARRARFVASTAPLTSILLRRV